MSKSMPTPLLDNNDDRSLQVEVRGIGATGVIVARAHLDYGNQDAAA